MLPYVECFKRLRLQQEQVMPSHFSTGALGDSVVRRVEQVYLVGGGIASLAAAVFMIRDGQLPGQNITILEEMNKLGGALDGAGTPEQGLSLIHI